MTRKNPLFLTGFSTSLDFLGLCLGGDEGDRTPGLGVANAALSQLSYIPVYFIEGRVIPYFLNLDSGGSIYDPRSECQEIVDVTCLPFFLTKRVPLTILLPRKQRQCLNILY
jgi:hypothetical protein